MKAIPKPAMTACLMVSLLLISIPMAGQNAGGFEQLLHKATRSRSRFTRQERFAGEGTRRQTRFSRQAVPGGRHVKDIDSHSVRALLASRALLVKIKRDLENHVRGLLKNLGLVIGRAKFNVFTVRAEELIEGRPELVAAVRPLLEARNAVEQQVSELDRKVMKLARHDAQVRRFMTVPGVGPITALAFKATIDDPARFARSRSVGAYVGLTSRRHASGEVDWSGRISKCGDAMLRSYLFEAAGVLLTRVPKWSAVKAWGVRLTKRNGLRKAKVAVARKLAVILHRMWIDGTEFNWSKKEIAA